MTEIRQNQIPYPSPDKIDKAIDFINADAFHDKRLSVFWKNWSWKGAFLAQ